MVGDPINLNDPAGLAPIPRSDRPKFDDLVTAYPNFDVAEVLAIPGGKVESNNYDNACAIRISRSLNYTGLAVPYIEGETSSGADKRWYIYRVRVLEEHLKRLFGEPDAALVKPASSAEIAGRKGIIVFDTTGTWSSATGHADLWNGSDCVKGCWFDESSRVLFWEVQSATP